jgi:quercetin dioxygenase-like cupin family protein
MKMSWESLGATEPDGTKEEAVTASRHLRWADIAPEQMNPLTTRQYVVGTDTMLARLVLKKGAHVPLHNHMNEQMSHVVEGALNFMIEGKVVTLRAGEILCIPPHVPHEVIALEDSVALDIFNPPRQDWIDGDDAYLRSSDSGTKDK